MANNRYAKNIYKQLGAELKIARVQAGYTTRGLAKETNLDKTTISNIERGTGGLLLHNILIIAMILNAGPVISDLISSYLTQASTSK